MKRFSLGRRLNMMSVVLIVPLTVLVVYLIISLLRFCNAYEQTVSNIDDTNAYSSYFKEDIDYTMYRAVIGSKTYDQIYDMPEEDRPYGWEQLKEPHRLIEESRETFQSVMGNTEGETNKDCIRWILHCLDQLEICVNEIEDGIKNNGSYDDNMEKLQLGIYIFTDDIQNKIQTYVYQEALNFNAIQNELRNQGQFAVQLSIVLLFTIVIAGVVVSRSITRSVAKPIQKLCKATERVGRGDFSKYAKVEASNEVAILADSFNIMQGEISHLIENIKEEQNQRRVMELQLLQEQINPHFLYNTLDTIIWLAEGGQDEEVVSMVTSLSDFFRSTLSGGRDYITIGEETRHIESYLEIQRVRYQDILEYEIQVDGRIASCPILKLTLQPLVENALYHGIKNKRGKGKIQVLGYQKGEEAVFEVHDNGIGMTTDEVEELKKAIKGEQSTSRRGFGLANVDERLRLNYGENYGLQFESTSGEGTTFKVHIPLQETNTK